MENMNMWLNFMINILVGFFPQSLAADVNLSFIVLV